MLAAIVLPCVRWASGYMLEADDYVSQGAPALLFVPDTYHQPPSS